MKALHPEHRDPSHSDGRVDIGLEETQNIDYRNLKSDIVKRIPFASVSYENGYYKPTTINKSLVGDYYISRGVSYNDISHVDAFDGNSLLTKKKGLQDWLSTISGEDYNYVPFNAFYQLSKEITNSTGLLLSKGVNINVDFVDSQQEVTTQYTIVGNTNDFFEVYFKITNNLGQSIYSDYDQQLILDKFQFKLFYEEEEVPFNNGDISFSNGIFTLKINTSYIKQSGKLTLVVNYIYYGIERKISCFVTTSEYTLVFFNYESTSIVGILNDPQIQEDEVNISFTGSINNLLQKEQEGGVTHHVLKFAVFHYNDGMQIDSVDKGSIKNDPIEIEKYKINSYCVYSNTLPSSMVDPITSLEIKAVCGDKTFNIILQ